MANNWWHKDITLKHLLFFYFSLNSKNSEEMIKIKKYNVCITIMTVYCKPHFSVWCAMMINWFNLDPIFIFWYICSKKQHIIYFILWHLTLFYIHCVWMCNAKRRVLFVFYCKLIGASLLSNWLNQEYYWDRMKKCGIYEQIMIFEIGMLKIEDCLCLI